MTNLLEESNVHLKTQSISSSVPLAAVPALSRPGHIDVHSYVVCTLSGSLAAAYLAAVTDNLLLLLPQFQTDVPV